MIVLTYFLPKFSFDSPAKHQKTFNKNVEMERWQEMSETLPRKHLLAQIK